MNFDEFTKLLQSLDIQGWHVENPTFKGDKLMYAEVHFDFRDHVRSVRNDEEEE